MTVTLDLAELAVEVVRKPIKHLHLGVYPPDGRVRIAAPERMGMDAIRLFTIGKLAWIRQQQKKMLAQDRDCEPEYIDRESHYLWGRRYLLKIVATNDAPTVRLRARAIDLHVRSRATPEQRAEVLHVWYRTQLRLALEPLLAKWQPLLGVNVDRVYLQRMKTKWGSCNPSLRNIRLNTELARKPRECLEYILVHELAHLREASHGPRFIALLDSALPQWRDLRESLNRLPLGHAAWGY
jgi:predicted metal-dependent hydrolase